MKTPSLLDTVLETLRCHRTELTAQFPVRRIAVFGSVARGDASDRSDVDILVEVDPSIGWELVILADQLEALLGRKVDLVSRRGIKPSLWKHIEPELVDV